MAVVILGWFVFAYCLISLLEHYFHKNHMHRNGWLNKIDHSWFEVHQKLHHPAYRGDFEHANPESHEGLGTRISHLKTVKYLGPVFVAFGYFFPVGSLIVFLTAMAHHTVWNLFHEEMHSPKGRFFSKWGVYRYLRKYHLIHHEHPRKNMNVVFPGADFLFGTYNAQ